MAKSVLGGLSSSRLDNALVRKNPVAVSVSAGASPFEDAGIVLVQADVKPGVDPAHVAKRLDAEIAAFLESGPTADERSEEPRLNSSHSCASRMPSSA